MSLPRSAFQARKPHRAGRPSWKVAEDYKRWLRKVPCAACKADPLDVRIVAAHVDHAGGKGMGTKVADKHCIPLCDACHIQQHATGWQTFEKTLPYTDAVALACIYWTEWPGLKIWEREQAEAAGVRAVR